MPCCKEPRGLSNYIYNGTYGMPFPSHPRRLRCPNRTHRSAPGGTDRLRRLPARAGSVGSRPEGWDAPRARCLDADDRGRAGGGRTVIYTTPVSRADGADVVMLPTDLSAETGVPPLTNAVEGTAEAGFLDEIAPRPRGLRLPQAPAERLLRHGRRRAPAHVAAHTIIIGGGATNRGVETSVGSLQPRLASVVVRECCWSGDPAAHGLQSRQGDENVRAHPNTRPGRRDAAGMRDHRTFVQNRAPSAVWHMAKILECGAAAVAVRTAPDCMMAVLHQDSFDVFPLREDYHCTPQSVASHTLYENADPFELRNPPAPCGPIKPATRRSPTARCAFRGRNSSMTRIHHQLEGVRQVGYSTILMGGVRDPYILAQIDSWLAQLDENIKTRIRNTVGERRMRSSPGSTAATVSWARWSRSAAARRWPRGLHSVGRDQRVTGAVPHDRDEPLAPRRAQSDP